MGIRTWTLYRLNIPMIAPLGKSINAVTVSLNSESASRTRPTLTMDDRLFCPNTNFTIWLTWNTSYSNEMYESYDKNHCDYLCYFFGLYYNTPHPNLSGNTGVNFQNQIDSKIMHVRPTHKPPIART